MAKSRTLKLALAFAAALLAPVSAFAAQPFMQVGGLTSQPVGHYDFCRRAPAECQVNPVRGPAPMTQAFWDRLVDVNNMVNLTVTPRTDMEMWGVEEYWSYPVNGYGDCEDYVLEKRRRLIEAGVPASNLLIAVVRQTNGDGHAVLVVTTSMGDFVLDNLEMRILRWNETEYTYLKRQAAHHAGMWVNINDARDVLVGSVSRR